MGLCIVRQEAELDPRYSEDGSFTLEVSPTDGILKELQFYFRGDHTTNITTAQTDGEHNILSTLRVTFPRRGLPDIKWNLLPRDLKFLTQFLFGQAPATANPTATTGVHFGQFVIPLALPAHLTRNPLAWGLDTRELAGPIIIEGEYGSLSSIGTGATVITHRTSVATCIEQRTRRPILPSWVLAGNSQRIPHDTTQDISTTIATGNIQALWALMLRQHDDSAQAAQRVDGLITRFRILHSSKELQNEFFIAMKKRTGRFFKLAAADLPAGIALPVFAEGGTIDEMPSLEGGRTMRLEHNSEETVPVEVTDVTPASGDAVYAITLGAMRTKLADDLDAATAGPRARR